MKKYGTMKQFLPVVVGAVALICQSNLMGETKVAAVKAVEIPVDISPPVIAITQEQVKDLFGDKPAKLVIAVRHGNPRDDFAFFRYFLVDLSKFPYVPVKILDTSWPKHCCSHNEVFISPDGTRMVFEDGDGVHICELKPGGPGRTRVAENGGYPSQPRWWVNPKTRDEFVIYCVKEDKDSKAPEFWFQTVGFGPGKTLIQKIEKGTCKPAGEHKILCDKYTFNGGRSPDGRYMCAGGSGWAIAEFKPEADENAFVKLLKTGPKNRCNPSINQGIDPKYPGRLMLWMDPGHTSIHLNPRLETEPEWKQEWEKGRDRDQPWEIATAFDNYKSFMPGKVVNGQLQYSEWSTHPDFFTVTVEGDVAESKAACQLYVWKLSQGKWTELARHGQKFAETGAYGNDFKGTIQGKMLASHLWVQQESGK